MIAAETTPELVRDSIVTWAHQVDTTIMGDIGQMKKAKTVTDSDHHKVFTIEASHLLALHFKSNDLINEEADCTVRLSEANEQSLA